MAIYKELLIDQGPYSDTETMLRFHDVDDVSSDAARNPHNRISIKLPGTKDMNAGDIFWEWTSTKAWRRFMKYPPKQSDLWRLANKLQLYGEEWDEEEQKAISQANARVIGSLPFSVEQVPAEEQLMLLGRASTEEEAQIMVYGHVRDSNKVAQLYTAPDPEEDERAAKAMEEMADAMVQLQEAVAAGHTDPSVLEVINETKSFFLHGVQPKRGLDAVDKFMMRKRTMMDQCGNASEHWVSFCGGLGGHSDEDGDGAAAAAAAAAAHCVSPHLLCALRVHTMNETDMDVVCPMQKGAFWVSDPEDRKCEGGGFNWTIGVSQENENITIQALRGTLSALLEDYTSTEDEDNTMIDAYESTVGSLDEGHLMSWIRYNAVLVRHREKVLLRETIAWLDDRSANLGNLTYQIEEVRRKEEVRKERVKERQAWRERIKEELSRPVPVASIMINLGEEAGGEVNFTWFEGQSLEDAALEFGVKHGLTYDGLDQLKAAARPRIPKQKHVAFFMPVVLADGIRAAIRVNTGENATLVADQFCARHAVDEVRFLFCIAGVLVFFLPVHLSFASSFFLSFPPLVYSWSQVLLLPDELPTNHHRFGRRRCLLRQEQDTTEKIIKEVGERYKKRMNRSLLLSFPIDAPDGRQLNFDVRQGEQHDLIRLVQDYALALHLNINVEQLANIVHGKLPSQIMELPVDISMQRRIILRVRAGDHPRELVEAFCEFFAIDPAVAGTSILTAVRKGLNPGAIVFPQDPYTLDEEEEEADASP